MITDTCPECGTRSRDGIYRTYNCTRSQFAQMTNQQASQESPYPDYGFKCGKCGTFSTRIGSDGLCRDCYDAAIRKAVGIVKLETIYKDNPPPAQMGFKETVATVKIQQGWQCPGCHVFYAPTVDRCTCSCVMKGEK